MSDDKWLMFKNYMHNEIGIGREDIRQWIRDAVEDEARRIVAQEAGKFDPKQIISRFVEERVMRWTSLDGHQQLRGEVARAIANSLIVEVRPAEHIATQYRTKSPEHLGQNGAADAPQAIVLEE
jgi:hypothetical protein